MNAARAKRLTPFGYSELRRFCIRWQKKDVRLSLNVFIVSGRRELPSGRAHPERTPFRPRSEAFGAIPGAFPSRWSALPHVQFPPCKHKKKDVQLSLNVFIVSGRRELNPRPLGPEPSALPLRYYPERALFSEGHLCHQDPVINAASMDPVAAEPLLMQRPVTVS